MPTLKENYYNNRGLGIGLLKEFEYDLDDGSTPEPTADVSTPLTSDNLSDEMKQLAKQVIQGIHSGKAKGIKYFISIHGREIPIEAAISVKDKLKAEYGAMASENPADTHDETNSIKLINVSKGKREQLMFLYH